MVPRFVFRQVLCVSWVGIALLLFAVATGCAGFNASNPAAAKQADDKAEGEKFKDNDLAIADYGKAIQFDPTNAKYYLDRGNADDIKALRDKTSLDPAIADYTKGIDLANAANSSFGLPMPPEQLRALLYDYRGVDYDKQGNFDQAVADFNKAIAVFPTLSYPYIHRGVAYREHGDYDLAIADFTKDLTLEPTWAQDYYDRGIAYQRKGENAQAVADFQMFLRLNPNAPERDQVQQLIDQLK